SVRRQRWPLGRELDGAHAVWSFGERPGDLDREVIRAQPYVGPPRLQHAERAHGEAAREHLVRGVLLLGRLGFDGKLPRRWLEPNSFVGLQKYLHGPPPRPDECKGAAIMPADLPCDRRARAVASVDAGRGAQ